MGKYFSKMYSKKRGMNRYMINFKFSNWTSINFISNNIKLNIYYYIVLYENNI